MNNGRLTGKVAVITGAASGFGKASAELFASEGASVIIADLDEAKAEEVAESISGSGGEAIAVRCDVTKADDAKAMVSAAMDSFGKLDVLFNNAGTTTVPTPMQELSEDDFDGVIAINLKAVFLCTQAAVPAMQENGGSVIVTSSIMGIRARPGFAAYTASKAGVIQMSRTLALELAEYGIRVNCLAPVAADTPMLATFIGDQDYEEGREKFISSVPLGRLAQSEDVAAAALYLASDESAFITGVTLPVDGGRGI